MFEDTIVVQSAVSAFNNAALSTPAFLWHGILAVPLFVLVYFCGNSFLERIGWKRENIVQRSSVFVAMMVFVWVILFGGNYHVLRDQISVLPFLVAAILFACSLFVVSNTQGVKLPQWKTASRRMRIVMVGIVTLVLAAIGVSDMHAWWGPLLQICAFLFGIVLGRRLKNGITPMFGTCVIMTMCVTAILMQPEFFRFGQLGNLTILHMLGLLTFGTCMAGCVVVNNVTAAGRISRGVFVKFKWLVRFVVLLGIALFFLTESVPVFLGLIAAMGMLFAMSVWHAKQMPVDMGVRFWALTLGAFGVVTTMPAITALGILCWTTHPDTKFIAESRDLL